MATKQLNLIYALKDNVITSVEDVEKGLKCGCTCPACGEVLVARKGTKVMHHFAHYTGKNCEFGYESSLHLAAKDILSRAKKFVIPAVYVHFPNSYKRPELVSAAKEIPIDSVELEMRHRDMIPDIVLYSVGKKLFVEIFVTHRIDEGKREKIKKANISTIEIDLSKIEKTITPDKLREILLSNHESKQWIHNTVEQKWLQYFVKTADKYEVVMRGFAIHVDNCPIKARTWHGKPYANVIDDCLGCKYCISASPDSEILCSGRQRIAKINDFFISIEKRIHDSNCAIQASIEEAIANGRCPNCGGRLVKRHSDYGYFLGCSNYPHCDYKSKCNQLDEDVQPAPAPEIPNIAMLYKKYSDICLEEKY